MASGLVALWHVGSSWSRDETHVRCSGRWILNHCTAREVQLLLFELMLSLLRASLVAQFGEESACNVGDLGLIPGLGRSPGEKNGYPLQYSGLENSVDCINTWGCKEVDLTK